jgi:hypothetical protein
MKDLDEFERMNERVLIAEGRRPARATIGAETPCSARASWRERLWHAVGVILSGLSAVQHV